MANFPAIGSSNAEGGGAEYYKGQYASLKFPKFEHKEYPKQVKDKTGKILGRAMNAKEEADLLEANGLEHSDIDPLKHALAEAAELRAKLSQYEGKDPTNQIAAKTSLKTTASVEMLPADTPVAETAPVVNNAPASVTGNPLLKDKVTPVANAHPPGTAPAAKPAVI